MQQPILSQRTRDSGPALRPQLGELLAGFRRGSDEVQTGFRRGSDGSKAGLGRVRGRSGLIQAPPPKPQYTAT